MHQAVLKFWFEEIDSSKWWVKDLAFDQLIKSKFLALHHSAMNCELYEWRKTPKGRLAEIIVLDQFSRNMFRDTPKSFASDSLALVLAQEAIDVKADEALSAIERSFLYIPFMHSESLKIHNVAIDLYKKNGIESNYDFEIKHRDIIEKFGRYPHRNQILSRESTDAEIEFLKQPGSGF
ncbi:DUF924 family protein [Pseudoalteromonas denitrificans]|uniref:Uncharacterized conserved protein, DUF924 family n=1 Tax=Pseudoalteromonas denitrificans DSM 6059 TaxID=1123010 RepID=A0A1I1NRM6_9GAMM|nr:DUF924 family protein [Pseudoalteromonas denitrificans]SFD00324.1 Uncharacterized conserved protein, DUF924 family [Pseudoalteromonas denitrificans DSM 6059]